jgi:hypothetical protein
VNPEGGAYFVIPDGGFDAIVFDMIVARIDTMLRVGHT